MAVASSLVIRSLVIQWVLGIGHWSFLVMIRLKSPQDIDQLTVGGKILGQILDRLAQECVVGVKPIDLDKLARQLITDTGCVPSFLNYAPPGHQPYPAALCISVNDAVVHGLPNNKELQAGDIVGLDLGLIYQKKYFLDSACTVAVGQITADAQHLISVTKEALARAIDQTVAGNKIGDISYAIQHYVESEGLEVVKQLVGHGVGFAVHESPQVPNFGRAHTGEKIKPGLVIAIEPMVTIGDPTVETADDGWSVKVKTGNLSAHFEHTIAVTEAGPKVLTSHD